MSIYPKYLEGILDIDNALKVAQNIKQWPNYSQTVLFSLDHLAKDLGVNKVWYKDEGTRFGLGSFKALGGAYAVVKQITDYLESKTSTKVSITDLLSGKYNDLIKDVSVSCATDGNHGKSVAWGAQLFGCECVIYIHNNVSKGREDAIVNYGAKVIRIPGNYDYSVKIAAQDAVKHNRVIVSDTSYEGYMEVPKDVALGYCVMLKEIADQLSGEIPTHIFMQGGVGGLASAICGYFWQLWGAKSPKFIMVEPVKANCLQLSAINGKPTIVSGELETLMAGLACGEVSVLAWDIIKPSTDQFITITEESVAPAMVYLADQYNIQAGESAIAGVAALMAADNREQMLREMNIDSNSNILLIGTEGATDPALYEQLTGYAAK
jgi:diaminopropionate ammonia-lyase